MQPQMRFTLVVTTSLLAASCVHPAAAFDAGQSTRLVTAAAIDKSGAQSVWEALQRTVPFYIFESDGTIRHRGRTSIGLPDPPVILLDGVSLTDVTVLRSIPATDVWLIEVVDGLDATQYYGTNAGRGAIRIHTKTDAS